MDEIVIDNLRVFCNHGVYAEERSEGQDFFVTAIVFLETYIAGVTDDLNNTVIMRGFVRLYLILCRIHSIILLRRLPKIWQR